MSIFCLHELVRPHLGDHHLQPDGPSYHAAISACERATQWIAALALLRLLDAQDGTPAVIPFNVSRFFALGRVDKLSCTLPFSTLHRI